MSNTQQIGNTTVDLNEEGYMTDLTQWSRQVGEHMAQNEGINMTDKHWDVVEFLQDQERKEIPLTIRKVGKSGVVSIKEFYSLFPKGPLKISSKIAGIPKPKSCI
ncbi:MAG: TusE/DsrC/DsvC family sulfur relay protein [Bacteroidia bacterium]